VTCSPFFLRNSTPHLPFFVLLRVPLPQRPRHGIFFLRLPLIFILERLKSLLHYFFFPLEVQLPSGPSFHFFLITLVRFFPLCAGSGKNFFPLLDRPLPSFFDPGSLSHKNRRVPFLPPEFFFFLVSLTIDLSRQVLVLFLALTTRSPESAGLPPD